MSKAVTRFHANMNLGRSPVRLLLAAPLLLVGACGGSPPADSSSGQADTVGDFESVYCALVSCSTATQSDIALSLAYTDRITSTVDSSNGLNIETDVVIDAPAETIIPIAVGDWNHWWHNGKATAVAHDGDGNVSVFQFEPTGNGFVNVTAVVAQPEQGTNANGPYTRYPVTLSGDFSGNAALVFQTNPDGTTTVSSIWTGVKNNKTLLPDWVAAQLHAEAEAGKLPFPRATGYPGLIQCVEEGICADDASP